MQSVNIAIHDKNVAYHIAEDSLIDVVNDNDNVSPSVQDNKVIYDLYDWLAGTGTTSHIMHRRDAFMTYELVPKIPVSLVGKNTSCAIGKVLQSECDSVIHTLQLNNVLHIPHTDHSLLSLGHWEQETRQQIHVQYGKLMLLTKEGIGVARGIHLSNRLYQLSFVLSCVPKMQNLHFMLKSTSLYGRHGTRNMGM